MLFRANDLGTEDAASSVQDCGADEDFVVLRYVHLQKLAFCKPF